MYCQELTVKNKTLMYFPQHQNLFSSLEEYVSTYQLPVSENSKVMSIEKPGELFQITVSSNNIIKNYSCRQVIIASGC
ncbi:MAG: NAD(P)-binding domain-containing protein [Ginsengibacter sp.]